MIALSYKELPNMTYRNAYTCSREQIECDLTFLGLLIMENKMKP